MEKALLSYHIKSYECDCNGDLRLLTLMNILQDVADTHASKLGVGIEYCRTQGLGWVGSNYHIKIGRMPKWHEKIEVISWPAMEKKLGAVRDFVITDAKGDVIIVASSQWILIDMQKRRPVSLRENLPFYKVIDERAFACDFEKIPNVEHTDTLKEFDVRYDDIDVNNHVNNALYPLWATESVGKEFRLGHQLQELEIAFKKEGIYGENVVILTQMDNLTSIHSIKSNTDERELAKIKITWQPR